MPTYTTQVTIPTVDNLAANYATNVWHCEADDATALVAFISNVKNFYNTIPDRMSALVRATDWYIKSYNVADPKPRAPVHEEEWDTGLTFGGSPLPPEVSLCVSYQAPKSSGINQARRRGRVYLPFINTTQNGSDGRPNAGIIADVQTAAQTLLNSSEASFTYNWVVYSPTSSATAIVTDGWIDNEWDTQRRRGRIATSRSTFS